MSETDNGAEQEVQEKTMAERAKEVGRDGAYLELDAKNLVEAFRCGELQKAKLVVIKAARIELSEQTAVKGLLSAVEAFVKDIDGANASSALEGMSDEQLSLLVLNESLTVGLEKE